MIWIISESNLRAGRGRNSAFQVAAEATAYQRLPHPVVSCEDKIGNHTVVIVEDDSHTRYDLANRMITQIIDKGGDNSYQYVLVDKAGRAGDEQFSVDHFVAITGLPAWLPGRR